MTATKLKYKLAPHLIYLDAKLRDLTARRITRLIINMPPRHGKSTLVCEYFIPWYLGMMPDHRVIYSSYEANFAAGWGRKARNVMEQYGHLFVHNNRELRVNPMSRAAAHWDIEKFRGGMETAGVGGALMGKGADLLIVDDPVKNEIEANSPLIRQRTDDWYKSTAYTRLEPNAVVIIIQTRWHYGDLSGIIINEMEQPDELGEYGEKYEVINFPAIANNPDNDVLGRSEGEVLWHERYPLKSILQKKRAIGSYWFSALFQQEPHSEEDEIFKRGWWQYYVERPNGNIIIQAWDTAMKEKEQNNYSVCTTWLLTPTGYYLLDMVRAKLILPDLLRQIKIEYNKWKPIEIVIEDKSSGTDAVNMLRRETNLPVNPVKAEGDKVYRASLITPLLEAGKVFLPEQAEFLSILIEETAQFPHSTYDDIVDSIVYGLSRLKTTYSATPSRARARKSRSRRSITDGF